MVIKKPSELGKLLEETLKSYGIAPDVPVTGAEKRLRLAVEGMEREFHAVASVVDDFAGKTLALKAQELRNMAVKAEREREELERTHTHQLDYLRGQIKLLEENGRTLGREREELKTKLGAWQEAFGTSQLSHATEKMSELSRRQDYEADWMRAQGEVNRLGLLVKELKRKEMRLTHQLITAQGEQRELKRRLETAHTALSKAADTFADFGRTLHLLRHHTAAGAAKVAEISIRETLRKGEQDG